MTNGYFQEAPPQVAQRRMKQGHKLTPPYEIAGGILMRIDCDCGWFTIGHPDFKDEYEHRAWEHRTEPMLLVAGSSDTLRSMRMETLRAMDLKRND